jgi:geranylgeranylglycerol-phosphate geranylgeranyltransferase
VVVVNIFDKIQAVHGLIKTELPVAAGICVIAGEIISRHPVAATEALLGFTVGFFLSGTAMMTNDYWDLEVDKINHPTRPLPSGKISITELWILAAFFSAVGLAAAALLGPVALAFSVIIWIVGFLYNWKYKESGLPGNMMVSLSVASTFILGGIAVGGLFNGVVWLFGGIAFFFDLGEEIAGGAMDVEGDAKRGARTLARVKGREFALRTSAVAFALVIVLTFLPYLFGWLGLTYLVLVVFLDLSVIFFTYGLLRSSTPSEGRGKIRALYVSMLIFVVVLLFSILLKWS